MKKTPIILLLCTTLTLLGGCAAAQTDKTQPVEKKPSVYTSFYAMYDFAAKIGGDRIQLVNLVPAGTEPHDWEPAASDITGLEKADVFIYNGAGMEHWATDVLSSLKNKDLIAVEASQGTELLTGNAEHEDESASNTKKAFGSHADEEGFDPHVWLNPSNAKIEMENIKNAFVSADPSGKEVYEANYKKYAAELDRLDKDFKDTLSTLKNKDIIVAHQAFGYLCAAYDLNQIPIEGLSADSEPDPARMAQIIAFAKEHSVKVIFFEELVNPKVAETIAKAISARTDVLNPLEGLSEEQQKSGGDYFSVMRENLSVLKNALE